MASTTDAAAHPAQSRDAPHLAEMAPTSPLEMTDFMTPPESNSPQDAKPDTSAPAPNAGQLSGPPTQSADGIGKQEPDTLPKKPPPAALQRSETEAIGPSSDHPTLHSDAASGPAVLITLLLTSGARHPYKIDDKYLRRREVKAEKMATDDTLNPFSISVYTLKELIWRDWREEWESRPSSPSAIRLIHFGRMLDDKVALKGTSLVSIVTSVPAFASLSC
jgi:hypothetical protein